MAAPAQSEQMRRLAGLLGVKLDPFSTGGESLTFGITGTELLVTIPTEPGEQDVQRQAELTRRVADRISIPVPEIVRVVAEAEAVVVRRLPGVPLIAVPTPQRAALTRSVALAVGTVLAELHTWDRDGYADLAPVDEYSPEEWRAETAELVSDLTPLLTTDQRDDVRRFLGRPAPRPAGRHVLSHNDLGIEHILVSPDAVTGVIDWNDAAITDPAYDFGLLLRDLGPEALRTALARYAHQIGGDPELLERASYYAVCALLEDLAFGHETGRVEYVAKSLHGWRWTFQAAG
ncbi:aminoglycoside phosphotransferase [Kribbella flavida DSM 17836]|uniref:Aminoglycoside phosphotransferase n=1 Tax=Kribbella flavida (strain DSM 17836 / JCM 10339 / NBRC 14399) TaxID=479435 RepID=D2Q2Q9_KRIFD|nr:aminoglycoside phosphotransferase family protein [Kribbella flavida]ADB30240.1 aminoglycoside phosphotransferase [Kribbella flavida DSM 17836]